MFKYQLAKHKYKDYGVVNFERERSAWNSYNSNNPMWFGTKMIGCAEGPQGDVIYAAANDDYLEIRVETGTSKRYIHPKEYKLNY